MKRGRWISKGEAFVFWPIATLALFWFPLYQVIARGFAHD